MTLERIRYDACPLCGCEAMTDLLAFDCSKHPLYQPQLPAAIQWCECFECKHVFTEGYFGTEAQALLVASAHDQEPESDPDRGRVVWSRVVERVTAVLRGGGGFAVAPGAGATGEGSLGRWLDVGFGDGALLLTAQEWGYQPLGIDLRPACVKKIVALGVPARCGALESIDDPASCTVISLADVVEHIPFPKTALDHVRKLLVADGLLFVATPNMDTGSWRVLDQARRNPYWAEIEHYHNFTRRRLYALLAEAGFEPVWYGVSNRYLCGMEVIARPCA